MTHMAGRYDMTCLKGATFEEILTWKDANRDPVDLSGYTARMQVRLTARAPEVLIGLTTENGRIQLGGANGTVTLKIAASDTVTFPSTPHAYDLELEDSDGRVTRLVEGIFNIKSNVTR